MFLKKWIATASLGGLLAGLALPPLVAEEPKPQRKAEAKVGLNKVLFFRHGKAVLMEGFDPKTVKVVLEPGKGEAIIQPRLSPDGKKIVYILYKETPAEPEKAPKPGEEQIPDPMKVMVCDVDGKNAVEVSKTYFGAAWANSSQEVFILDIDLKAPTPKGKQPPFKASILNITTKKTTELPVPAGHMPFDLSLDGKFIVTQLSDVINWKPVLYICRVSRDGKEVTKATDPAYLAYNGHLTHDGKAVLFAGDQLPDKMPNQPLPNNVRVFMQPIGGKAQELPGFPKNAALKDIQLSPDGKQIAYIWRQVHKEAIEEGKEDERETLSHLCVCDIDGKNHRTILTEKGKGPEESLGSISWR